MSRTVAAATRKTGCIAGIAVEGWQGPRSECRHGGRLARHDGRRHQVAPTFDRGAQQQYSLWKSLEEQMKVVGGALGRPLASPSPQAGTRS